MALHDPHRRHLEGLARRDRLRAIAPRAGIDFASNDYLGLAGSAELRAAAEEALRSGVPLGSGGSRLLRGNHAEHEALEAEAASFFGSESALWLSSGYAANSALLATLPQRGDLIVHDALIHASAHEGMRLSRADAVSASHNEADSFADAIGVWRDGGGKGRPWICVESLYSMDGDRAPLDALADVADRHEAFLLIDEAHATGVFGADGRGLAGALEGRENIITLHTCGKALGCEGALIAGPRVLTDYLVNQGRSFIFSTAPSPLMAAVARAALRLVRAQPERRERLAALVAHGAALFRDRLGIEPAGSQIQPVILGDNGRTMRVAALLQEAGFDVRGIRPPTVPEGGARLRVSLTLNVDTSDVDALVAAIGAAL